MILCRKHSFANERLRKLKFSEIEITPNEWNEFQWNYVQLKVRRSFNVVDNFQLKIFKLECRFCVTRRISVHFIFSKQNNLVIDGNLLLKTVQILRRVLLTQKKYVSHRRLSTGVYLVLNTNYYLLWVHFVLLCLTNYPYELYFQISWWWSKQVESFFILI